MNPTKSLLIVIMLLLPALSFAQPVNLNHPSSQPDGKLETQRYDKLSFFIKGTGYVPYYGELSEQDFDHPKFEDGDHITPIEEFFASQLGFDSGAIVDGFAHFSREDQQYYLKLSTFASSYSYKLLKVAPCPKVVSLPVSTEYLQKDGTDTIPEHALIPNVEGFIISDVDYSNYDEVVFYYAKSGHTHKGKFWEIDYKKTAAGSDSYRYIVAHDYKEKLLAMGGEILKDEDNNFVFKYEGATAKLACYDGAFSLKIIQEESFRQSLVPTPDTIKTELDKSGKITLEGIYFDFNKASLKPESRQAILSTVALMERYGDLVLSIHGHTDNKGTEEYNRALSADRAASVVAALVAEGIDGSRLQSRGFGETEPVATNDTDAGRATNRRVELHKVSGGLEKSFFTIDFIKPLENSVIESRKSHDSSTLGVQYKEPYSKESAWVEYAGHLDVISYEIIKDGAVDESISRKEIIKNYENVLEIYNAKILGIEGSNLSFHIPDRGDGRQVFGRIEGYTGSYTIRFLILEK